MNNKLIGPPEAYIDILDREMIEQVLQERTEKKNPLRPSSAGECTRALGYLLNEYRGNAQYPNEEPKPDLHRLFKLGHAIEADLIKLLEQVPEFKVTYKQQVVSFFQLPTTSEWIEGSIDLVIMSDEFKAVADVKSKKQKYSSWSATDWEQTNEKLEQMSSVDRINERLFWIGDLEAFLTELHDPYLAMNFYQLNMYANSQFIKERGIDHALIIQYGKNDSKLREIRFKPSVAIYERTKAKYLSVAAAIDERKNPEELPRDFPLGSIKCAFCRFSTECRPDSDSLKEYFNTWPDKDWPRDAHKLGADGETIELLFKEHQEAQNQGAKAEYLEGQICGLLERHKARKIKLDNGQVWELRALKTGLVIRRGKL